MVVDPETLARRRQDKIAALTARRDALLDTLKQAEKREVWRVKALLISTERALRWQLSREGFSAGECGISKKIGENPGNNTRPAARPPIGASSSPTL